MVRQKCSGIRRSYSDLNSSSDDIERAFSNINPFTCNAQLIINTLPQVVHADWFAYFKWSNDKIIENINKLMNSRLSIDVETLHLLNVISDSPWVSLLSQFENMKFQLRKFGNPFVNPTLEQHHCVRSILILKRMSLNLGR